MCRGRTTTQKKNCRNLFAEQHFNNVVTCPTYAQVIKTDHFPNSSSLNMQTWRGSKLTHTLLGDSLTVDLLPSISILTEEGFAGRMDQRDTGSGIFWFQSRLWHKGIMISPAINCGQTGPTRYYYYKLRNLRGGRGRRILDTWLAGDAMIILLLGLWIPGWSSSLPSCPQLTLG